MNCYVKGCSVTDTMLKAALYEVGILNPEVVPGNACGLAVRCFGLGPTFEQACAAFCVVGCLTQLSSPIGDWCPSPNRCPQRYARRT